MASHPNAWRDQNIVVLARDSFAAVQIEQAIANAIPASEISLESFWNYQEAYDYCRDKTKVGLLFISPKINLPVDDVVEQLGRFYQYYGTTLRAVLILDEKDSELEAYKMRIHQPRILTSINLSQLTDPARAHYIIDNIWKEYRRSVETECFPKSLQDTLVTFTSDKLDSESRVYMDRLSTLLSSNLNLSWLEHIAVKWAPVLNVAQQKDSSILLGSEFILSLANLASQAQPPDLIAAIKDKNINLVARLYLLVNELNSQRIGKKLPTFIAKLSALNKPGAPALLRHTLQNADNILEFAGIGKSIVQNPATVKKVG